jgi:hypothetical protein
MKDLAYFVSRLATLEANPWHSDLATKRVLVRNPTPELCEALEQAGATLLTPCEAAASDAGSELPGLPRGERADLAFLDLRDLGGDTCVPVLSALPEWMRSVLTVDGTAFAILRTAAAYPNFDIANPLLDTGHGVHPTERFLLDHLFAPLAVRILDFVSQDDERVKTSFYRLTAKRPSLILVLGAGHSGKTTLARDLLSLDPKMHVSGDYIYAELHKLAEYGEASRWPAAILERLGDGSGMACFDFNRSLDSDTELLRSYAKTVTALIPRGLPIVSLDLDIQNAESVEVLKDCFTQAGFSVWVATR